MQQNPLCVHLQCTKKNNHHPYPPRLDYLMVAVQTALHLDQLLEVILRGKTKVDISNVHGEFDQHANRRWCRRLIACWLSPLVS